MGNERRREWDRRRRERIRTNGTRETYTLDDIGERDSWHCGICRAPVDRQFHAPDPRSPSIDHIESVSSGGTDTKDNVRLTHLFCNMDRNYVDKPTWSPVRVIRDPSGKVKVVVGEEPIDGEVMLDRRMLHPRTPAQARARLARRVARYEAERPKGLSTDGEP